MPRELHFDQTHGDRVTIGFGGPKGIVYRCPRKDGAGSYFKVKLANGTWTWPDGAVADSTGEYVCRCRECRIPFKSDQPKERLCPNCDRRLDRPGQPGDVAHGFGRRRSG